MAPSKQRLGGLALAATHDPNEYTRAARKALADSFMEKVDPDGKLRKKNPAEAERRAKAAKTLHYARLAFLAAKARKAKKARVA
jgi:hypothetical protein